jgi:hypothetical protein
MIGSANGTGSAVVSGDDVSGDDVSGGDVSGGDVSGDRSEVSTVGSSVFTGRVVVSDPVVTTGRGGAPLSTHPTARDPRTTSATTVLRRTFTTTLSVR